MRALLVMDEESSSTQVSGVRASDPTYCTALKPEIPNCKYTVPVMLIKLRTGELNPGIAVVKTSWHAKLAGVRPHERSG